MGANPIEITAADFDGKNGTDLAVACDGSSVTILLNNGHGNFTEPASSPEAGPGGGITSANLDGDDDIDLAVGSFDNPGQGVVLLNDGSADFTAGDTHTSVAAEFVENADVDGDGDRDVVELTGSGEAAVVAFNDGDGNLADPVAAGGTGGNNANGIAVGRIGRGPSRRHRPRRARGCLRLPQRRRRRLHSVAALAPGKRSLLWRGSHRRRGWRRPGGDILAGRQTHRGKAVAVFLSKRHGRFNEPRTSPEVIADGAGLPWLATGSLDRCRGRDVAAAIEGAVSILLNRSRAC